MAAATMRMRFLSLVRPAFLTLPKRRRKQAESGRYHLIVAERSVWHPQLGWRPTPRYMWVRLDDDGRA